MYTYIRIYIYTYIYVYIYICMLYLPFLWGWFGLRSFVSQLSQASCLLPAGGTSARLRWCLFQLGWGFGCFCRFGILFVGVPIVRAYLRCTLRPLIFGGFHSVGIASRTAARVLTWGIPSRSPGSQGCWHMEQNRQSCCCPVAWYEALGTKHPGRKHLSDCVKYVAARMVFASMWYCRHRA